jgi:hypothetical protein
MLIVGVVACSSMTDEDLATVKAERDRLRLELEAVTVDRDRFSRGLARLAGLWLYRASVDGPGPAATSPHAVAALISAAADPTVGSAITFTPRSCSSNTVGVKKLIVRRPSTPGGGTHIGVVL